MLIFSFNLQAQDVPKHSKEQLDQMMAPIALYPDALLSQILMASTFNKELKEAIAYSKEHPEEKGDKAVEKVQDKGWDASVSSLVAFPEVLSMLGAKPKWAKDLGNAFLAEPQRVMNSVQGLRKRAKEAGNLKSTKEQTITSSDANNTQIIEIVPAQPQTVYVPVYNPVYVYGPWMYPAYPPFYYYPPYPHYGFGVGLTIGIGFGVAIVAHNCVWGGFAWHSHNVNINVNRYNNINVNKLDVKKKNVNWDRNKAKNKTRPKTSSKDLQRKNAQKALKKNGLSPSEGREKLSGSNGTKLRQNLQSGKFNSSVFSGAKSPSNSRLEASRGSSSRSSINKNSNFSNYGGFSGRNFNRGASHGHSPRRRRR